MLAWLKHYKHKSFQPINEFSYKKTDYKKGNQIPTVDDSWGTFGGTDIFSGYDEHAWFYKRVVISDDMQGKNLYLQFSTGIWDWDAVNPQFIVYINGEMVQALDTNHTTVKLDSHLKEFDLHLYAYTGSIAPDTFSGQRALPRFFLGGGILEIDALTEKVYYDLKVPYEILEYTEENTKEYQDLLKAVTNILNLLDFRKPYSKEYYDGLNKASEYADDEVYGKLCKKSLPQVTCIGHTHIDIAWLWTIAQTREKAQRSFSTVINLMKQYPEYKFMSSQAFLYEMVKEEAPELYEEIKKAIKDGRWEVEGSMWVEADCNLASGESLVRQILVGKNFFRKEFGIDTKILWLPDVFGYSAAMPQILKKAGVDKFVTSKISWNDTNQMPYDLFMWKGIDGTELFTYFLTAQSKVKGQKPTNFTAYMAMGEPKQIAGSWDRFQQKELANEAIVTYGYADGGGGPTSEHIEQIKRMSYGLPNCPTAVFDTATNFLNRVYESSKDSKYLKKWDGELYLEYHRGTYTTQAKNKKYNRKAEFALGNVESLSVLSEALLNMSYPKTDMEDCWKIALTNQFHDIIPGSSIKEVYEDSDKDYQKLFEKLEELQAERETKIAENITTEGGLLVWNPLPFVNSGNVLIDGKMQFVKDIPAKGYKVVKETEEKKTVFLGDKVLENDFYRICFDDNFDIISLYSKKYCREILQKDQKANTLLVFEDIPHVHEAWEIRRYYKEKQWNVEELVSVEPVYEGSRAGLRIVKRFMTSEIRQTIYLYDETERIDFVTDLDWDIEQTCLKVAFPIDINTSKATYDIQFGSIERNTHENTSWDEAKFEVCAHKYADLSDNGFGVTLMNDCKYGYDIQDGVMRLTLLRCSVCPNPESDKGRHSFTYALYIHENGVQQSDAIKLAYDLNNPMHALKLCKNNSGLLPESYSLVSANQENILLETIKEAENTSDVIVRGYECNNRLTDVEITLGFSAKKAYICNLMEEKESEIPIIEGKVSLKVKPFEIFSILFER